MPVILCSVLLPQIIRGQLQIVPEQTAQCVFAGEGRRLRVTVRNPGDEVAETQLGMRLHQAASATAVLLGETPWKKLKMLGGQTVLEFATVKFPAVKAETRFLVQWVEASNKVIGTTEVLVYPPDLLKDLKSLSGDKPVGAFDPRNQLKPLLKDVGVKVLDLEEAGLEDFEGKLAIVGPFQSKSQMREGLSDQIEKLATKGAAVVWIQPPTGRGEKVQPSFYAVPVGKGAVVVVQAELVSNLPENPLANLNLIHCARLALNPEPPRLP